MILFAEGYHLAFVVGSEDKDNWAWFLNELQLILDVECRITFIYDRHPGIIKGVKKILLNGYRSFYMFHISITSWISWREFTQVSIIGLCICSVSVHTLLITNGVTQIWTYYIRREGKESRILWRTYHYIIDVMHFSLVKGMVRCHLSQPNLGNKMIEQSRHMLITSIIDNICVQSMKKKCWRRGQSVGLGIGPFLSRCISYYKKALSIGST